MNYEIAETFAKKNLDTIVKNLPHRLVRKENSLFKRVIISKESPIEQLEKLYVFMDDLYSFVNKSTPCHKGCAHCCHIPVSISLLEGKYIENRLGIKQASNFSKNDFLGIPCPFLSENICSIYKYRPFVCRRHLALFNDPLWCQIDLGNKYKFTNIAFSEVDKSFFFIIRQSEDISLYDIRQLFDRVSG